MSYNEASSVLRRRTKVYDDEKHKGGEAVNRSKAVLLFPDFFCTDVWENCKNHAYEVATYSIEEDLAVRPEVLKNAIKRYNPDVLFIFHPLGIQNELLTKELFETYNGYVIEDCVHRIIEPHKLKLMSDRHIVIDSTRKLTPLPGSCIWAQKGTLNYLPQGQTLETKADAEKALKFWEEFQNLLLSENFDQVQFAYQLLNSGDNLIGDSLTPVTLDLTFLERRQHLAHHHIAQKKTDQYNLYQSELANVLNDQRFVIPWRRPHNFDPAQPAFYPIIMRSDYTFLLKEYLLKHAIQTFVEFSDSPWAINKNVLCLPLGPHVNTDQLKIVCVTVINWFLERSTLT